jgi:hypothetical protein
MVGSGLVNSLAHPGGNTTGTSIFATELDGKRQENLIEAVPGLRRMAALADSTTTTDANLHALQEAARARNIELSIHRIARPEEIAAAIDAVKGVGCRSAKRFVGTHPLQQSPDYYATRRGAGPARHLSISGRGGRGRFCRLRPAYRPNVSRANGPAARQSAA